MSQHILFFPRHCVQLKHFYVTGDMNRFNSNFIVKMSLFVGTWWGKKPQHWWL